MKEKKKVLFFTSPEVGGAERVTITIAKMLPVSEYDVTIAVVGKHIGEIVKFVPNYMKVHFIRISNIWDFTTFKMVRLMKQFKPDIVFCSLFYLNIRVVFAAKLVGGIKTIVRNNISFYRSKSINSFLIKKAYKKADVIVCQTNEMLAEMKGIKKLDYSKVTVIRNPIDIDTISKQLANSHSPYDGKHVEYVYVGRITASKGTDLLISAFAKTVRQVPNAKLHIIGKLLPDDAFQQDLKKEVEEQCLSKKVVWEGFKGNPYPYIKYADCFVLPSRNEGLPNVALEAMYLQTPIVATRSVPVIDRLIPRERGIVVDTEDVDGIADAMQKALSLMVKTPYDELGTEEWLKLFE